MTSKEEVAEIRRLIKRVAPTLSVRMGRGTARWWIDVSGSGEWGAFTQVEQLQLQELGLPHGLNRAVISPDERPYWIRALQAPYP